MQDAFPSSVPSPTISLILDSVTYQGQNQIRRSAQHVAVNYQGSGFTEKTFTIAPNDLVEIDDAIGAFTVATSGQLRTTLGISMGEQVVLTVNKYMVYDNFIGLLKFENLGTTDVQVDLCYLKSSSA